MLCPARAKDLAVSPEPKGWFVLAAFRPSGPSFLGFLLYVLKRTESAKSAPVDASARTAESPFAGSLLGSVFTAGFPPSVSIFTAGSASAASAFTAEPSDSILALPIRVSTQVCQQHSRRTSASRRELWECFETLHPARERQWRQRTTVGLQGWTFVGDRTLAALAALKALSVGLWGVSAATSCLGF